LGVFSYIGIDHANICVFSWPISDSRLRTRKASDIIGEEEEEEEKEEEEEEEQHGSQD